MNTSIHYWLITALCLICSAGCQSTSQSQDAPVQARISQPVVVSDTDTVSEKSTTVHSFLTGHLKRLDHAVERAIQEGKLPGGVLWLQHEDDIYTRTYGSRSVDPQRESMTADSIFDAASLTKVIATTPAIMKLIESGRINVMHP